MMSELRVSGNSNGMIGNNNNGNGNGNGSGSSDSSQSPSNPQDPKRVSHHFGPGASSGPSPSTQSSSSYSSSEFNNQSSATANYMRNASRGEFGTNSTEITGVINPSLSMSGSGTWNGMGFGQSTMRGMDGMDEEED